MLHQKLTAALLQLEPSAVSANIAESQRIAHYQQLNAAYRQGMVLIREVNAFLNSQRRLSTASLKARYGLAEGVPRNFTNSQIESHLREFGTLQDDPELPAAARLSEAVSADIEAVLTAIDIHKGPAQRAARQSAHAFERSAVLQARDALSRTKSHLDATLPRGSFDPLLSAYGFTPRQRPVRKRRVSPPPAPSASAPAHEVTSAV